MQRSGRGFYNASFSELILKLEANNFDFALRSLKTDIKFSKEVGLPKN